MNNYDYENHSHNLLDRCQALLVFHYQKLLRYLILGANLVGRIAE